MNKVAVVAKEAVVNKVAVAAKEAVVNKEPVMATEKVNGLVLNDNCNVIPYNTFEGKFLQMCNVTLCHAVH